MDQYRTTTTTRKRCPPPEEKIGPSPTNGSRAQIRVLPLTTSSTDEQRSGSLTSRLVRRRTNNKKKRAFLRMLLPSAGGALIYCILPKTMMMFKFNCNFKRHYREQEILEQFPENNNTDADTKKNILKYTISQTAKMANELMRTKGVLLRWEEAQTELFDQNGRDYMPAAFVHASTQAPNVMFKWDIDNIEFDAGPRVAYLTGSKFEPELQSLSNNYLEEKVNCRAYFPIDAWSGNRNHRIDDNPLGTSCTEYQELNPLSLFNVTNG